MVWYRVIWSDESKFNLFVSDGRFYVGKRAGEDFLPECIKQTEKFGGGIVMMWVCVSGEGMGSLMRAEGRLNEDGYLHLLLRQALPHAQALGPESIFMKTMLHATEHARYEFV